MGVGAYGRPVLAPVRALAALWAPNCFVCWIFGTFLVLIFSFVNFKNVFYPWSPKVEPWVNRWTFSSPPSFPSSPSAPPPSHHQIFVSLRYRKHQFSNWFDFPGNSSDSYLFLLLLLLFPGAYFSGELSTPVWRTVHRLQAVQCTASCLLTSTAYECRIL